jgi:hypothetical protein
MCRTGTSPGGEASTILLTFPSAKIGTTTKGAGNGQTMSEDRLARCIIQGIFILLRLQQKVYDFDVNDPMPDGDAVFDKPSDGLHIIFNAARDDPNYKEQSKFDVVTDGNFQINRKLQDDERMYANKNLPGRPKRSKKQRVTAKGVVTAKPKSRCKHVEKVETMMLSRTQTGGLFVTMNMKNCGGRKNKILHLGEMLNGENTAYKRKCLKDMRKTKMKVRKYCHDCACGVGPQFDGVLVEESRLDGFHGKKHKCDWPAIEHKKRLNSSAAEQLWARLDKLSWLAKMTRPHYRCFLFHYCLWRNAFLLGSGRTDANPCLSRRKRLKRMPMMRMKKSTR